MIPTAQVAEKLIAQLRSYGRPAVAFSGGVDSTVVAQAAFGAWGVDAVALTGRSPSVASEELADACRLAAHIGIRHAIVDTHEFANPAYRANDGRRCYYCKSELYDRVLELKEQFGFEVLCSGANRDDQGDYRPGLQAAAERDVRHPLQELALGKDDVRALARYWKLPNWNKPASPCLASRLAVGVAVSPERLERVEKAERLLKDLGFEPVRVRYHEGDHARIEVSLEQLTQLVDAEIRQRVTERLRALGFKFVTVDLEGFRSGSLNVLVAPEWLAHDREARSVR